ncbi:MAG: non-homologous end-joining DNA ligase [Limnochordia bacterium]|jgi:bifunctional non-homologous end joining protein LigD|nr:non-homologous end-joining DNA ligase [Limnochordia bacterium]
MTTKQIVQVEGKSLKVSNLDKVFWPKQGLTKADLLDYHTKLSALTQKHWQGRTLTVTRYPHGVEGDFFYQKNIPSAAPPWVVSHRVEDTEYVVAGNLATISWLANSAAIEFHPSTYTISSLGVPSYAIIDLDPTAPQGFAEAVQVGKHCRDVLWEMGLRGYPKLSGRTGLHIYIPLENRYDFQITSHLVKVIGLALKRRLPEKVTLERLIKNRHGVYVDYLQNHPGKTIVGVYSPRPTPQATVSTPVRWDDLDYYVPQDFTLKTVPEWIREKGDLFDPVLTEPQALEHLLFLE